MLEKLKNHILIKTFRELKGNTKWSICSEPFWFIPHSLFAPFQTLYMSKIGLNSLEIGTTLTVGFIVQMLCALIGGVITDKMGRRKTTVIFDTLGWTIPCLIWAFSQNFLCFLIAAAINATCQITNTSWTCLFTEDCPDKYITTAFTLTQMCGMLSVFFAPLAVVLVGKYDVVPVMRWIYFISAFSMLIKFLMLYYFGNETEIGRQRMEETKDISYFTMLKGYKDVFLQMLKSSKMRLVVYFMALSNISQIATGSFFSLYVTEKLHLSDSIVAVFPVIRTFVMLAFVIGLQRIFEELRMKYSFAIGFLMYIVSHLLLLSAPEGNLLMAVGYTFLEAAAYAVIVPRRDAIMTYYADKQERSRIYALYFVLMTVISVPFGSIVGGLFDINPGYPFIFNIILFGIGISFSLFSRDLAQLEETIE